MNNLKNTDMNYKITEYGQEKILSKGEKVKCVYYHEYPHRSNDFNDSFIQRLIDSPFKPVKFGVILGSAGIKPYWLSSNKEGTEEYLYVEFSEYFFKKAIPISCIENAKIEAKRMNDFVEKNRHKIGTKGYSEESFLSLKSQIKESNIFTKWLLTKAT